jgi:hypothetical protein
MFTFRFVLTPIKTSDMKKMKICALLWLCQLGLWAQNDNKMNNLPYREIPVYPESYTAENVVARMIDGLGFRFYWATEGLRPEDLAFRPMPTARSSEETIDHILGLSIIVLNTLKDQPNVRSGEESSVLTFEVKRKKTLEILQEASNLLKQAETKLKDHTIVFQNGANKTEFPFWNLINGPIADALWHVGQVVTFRRSSGNPFNSKASVLTGKVRE